MKEHVISAIKVVLFLLDASGDCNGYSYHIPNSRKVRELLVKALKELE